MTTKTTYRCNDCGSEISEAQAGLYSGVHTGATAQVAGEAFWHSCGDACAARHLRDLADKVEAHGAEWRAKQAALEANRAAFAKATAPGAPPVRGEVPTLGAGAGVDSRSPK